MAEKVNLIAVTASDVEWNWCPHRGWTAIKPVYRWNVIFGWMPMNTRKQGRLPLVTRG